MERKVISSLLKDRHSYNKISKVLEKEDFSDVGWLVVQGISTYYDMDTEVNEVDVEVLSDRLSRQNPAMEKSLGVFFDNVEPVSAPNIIAEYIDTKLNSLSLRIGHALATNHMQDGVALMQEWQELKALGEDKLFGTGDDEVITEGFDLDDLLDVNHTEQLVPFYPDQINEVLGGGAPAGSHITIFARPEVGKSLFCINLTANFLKEGLQVLYIGNEDPAKSMKRRILSNIMEVPTIDLKNETTGEFTEELNERAPGNLVFAGLSPGSVRDVRNLVEKHRPDVVVVDQMRNLIPAKSFSKTEELEHIAQELRNIGKEFNTVMVSVTQAGDSATGKLELTMGDIDFSNTGIPAACDVLMGIACTEQLNAVNQRRISFPKNKLSGSHESVSVHVNTQLNQVF